MTASKALIEAEYYDQKWEVCVKAVPAKHKSAVRELLMNKALPQVKQWLSSPREEDWGRGGTALDFFVLLPELELTSTERRWD